nr:immunoglobulin light chain junction region [Macaca mulatta]
LTYCGSWDSSGTGLF